MASIWDANKIAQARNSSDLTAESAANVLGITPEYLSMLENGHRTPSQKLLSKMAVLYRKPVSFFLREEKNFVSA
ncbi:MAG TPA: helix-turn-helix transcriptional regulator [Pyrinomonadaceae bacterium]|nr:helix-turn-helix transcriptional regulator [Pyrinomonadaceae bacterium]